MLLNDIPWEVSPGDYILINCMAILLKSKGGFEARGNRRRNKQAGNIFSMSSVPNFTCQMPNVKGLCYTWRETSSGFLHFVFRLSLWPGSLQCFLGSPSLLVICTSLSSSDVLHCTIVRGLQHRRLAEWARGRIIDKTLICSGHQDRGAEL